METMMKMTCVGCGVNIWIMNSKSRGRPLENTTTSSREPDLTEV